MTLDTIETHLSAHPIPGVTHSRTEDGRLRLMVGRRTVFFDPQTGTNGYLVIFNSEGWRQLGSFVPSLDKFEVTLKQLVSDCS